MITSHHILNQSKLSLPTLSSFLDHSLSLSLPSIASLHAHILKLNLHSPPFLANRLLYLYSHLTPLPSTLHFFQELPTKNTFTYNILLSALFDHCRIEDAHHLFLKMPERDSVTYNSIISGYGSLGLTQNAFKMLYQMKELGFTCTKFTFSIAAHYVCSTRQAKEVHGSTIRHGFDSSNIVVHNSLIDMYGRVGLVDCASSVFRCMGTRDKVSWNTMISVFGNCGNGDRAFQCFQAMRARGLSLDAFTVSAVMSVCTDFEDVAKGEQLLGHCFKMGYLSNSIVSSAVIDMYSKCGRLDDSVRLFQEMTRWDSALCNSMASAYSQNLLVSKALRLFVETVRVGIRPTEFTFASILSSSSCFGLCEQGTQIHSWVVKLGLEEETIVASALVDMYMKLGLVGDAMRIFSYMAIKDLISCNTMIMGLTQNGEAVKALGMFKQVLTSGLQPDRITLFGALSACSYLGMVSEGMSIFSSMEKKCGIKRGLEHYTCMVDMMSRAGRLREAMEIIETMPYKPTVPIWGLLLEACRVHGDLKFAEIVAEKVMELEPRCALPYLVLAQKYGMRGRWESMARVWKFMKERGVKKVGGCSWIGIKNHVFVFKSESILHLGGEATYAVLHLLVWEMEREGYVPEQYVGLDDYLEE